MTQGYPRQVEMFHTQLQRIPGVVQVDTSITGLAEITRELIGQPDLAQLPHTAILRGPRTPSDALIQTEIEFERTMTGWRGLEFLAWAVKDLARSGELVQLRPVALPPVARGNVQLGQTLLFEFELFITLEDDAKPALEKLEAISKSFRRYIELYETALFGG